MGEVLEHLTDPREMLEIVHGILQPGGVLSLIVPNDFNPFQEVLWRDLGYTPWWVAPPHHLNYFDHRSLGGLLTSCGFEIVDSTSTFPIDIFLLMGESYIGDDLKGRELHKLRKTFDSNLLKGSGKDLRRKILRGFSNIGLGREIDLICKKTAGAGYQKRINRE
jgi:SAM-dependent methyltransferase